MNGRSQMQGGKKWILPKEINANRFFQDSHWLEIWENQLCPSMGPNGGSVALDFVRVYINNLYLNLEYFLKTYTSIVQYFILYCNVQL
jgi:hypothetical protein